MTQGSANTAAVAAAAGAEAAAGAAGNSGLGVRLALLGVAMALAAINTGNNLIYLMLSLVLALAFVGAIAGRRAARRLSVEAHLPREVRAGEPFTIHVEARGRFPLLPRALVVARLDGLPEIVEIPISVSSGDERGVASTRVTVGRRGIHEALSVTARTGYPFNLALMGTRARAAGDVVVLPSFVPLRAMHVGAAHASPMMVRAQAIVTRGAGSEVLDLREYAPEDDARHIDWRASARTRRLMVREFEREDAGRSYDVVIDTEAGDDAAFEGVVSRCAAILDFAGRHGHSARLVTPDAGPLGRDAAMRWLAGAQRNGAQGIARGHVTPRGTQRIIVSADPSRATPLRMVT